MAEIFREDNTYAHISTVATTQVHTGPAVLKAIVLNEATAGAVSIIDNTTGTTVNVGLIAASTAAQTLEYNTVLRTGIRIITAGADDMTVVYKPLNP